MGLEEDLVIKEPTITDKNKLIEHMFSGFIRDGTTLDKAQLTDLIQRANAFRDTYHAPLDKNALDFVFLSEEEVAVIREVVDDIKSGNFEFIPTEGFPERFEDAYEKSSAEFLDFVKSVTSNLEPGDLSNPRRQQYRDNFANSKHLTSDEQRKALALEYLYDDHERFSGKVHREISDVLRRDNPTGGSDPHRFDMNVYRMPKENRSIEEVTVRVKGTKIGYKAAKQLIELVELVDNFDRQDEQYVRDVMKLLKVGDNTDDSTVGRRARVAMEQVLNNAMLSGGKSNILIPLDYILITDMLGFAVLTQEESQFNIDKIRYFSNLITVKSKRPEKEKSTGGSGKKDLRQTQIRYFDRATGLFYDLHLSDPLGFVQYHFGKDRHDLIPGRSDAEMSKDPKYGQQYQKMRDHILGIHRDLNLTSIEEPLFGEEEDSLERKLAILDKVRAQYHIDKKATKPKNGKPMKMQWQRGGKTVGMYRQSMLSDLEYLFNHWEQLINELPSYSIDILFAGKASRRGDPRLRLSTFMKTVEDASEAFESDYKFIFGGNHNKEGFKQMEHAWDQLREIAEEGQKMYLAQEGYEAFEGKIKLRGESWTLLDHMMWYDSFGDAMIEQKEKIQNSKGHLRDRMLELQFFYHLLRLEVDLDYLTLLSEGGSILDESEKVDPIDSVLQFAGRSLEKADASKEFFEEYIRGKGITTTVREIQFIGVYKQHSQVGDKLLDAFSE